MWQSVPDLHSKPKEYLMTAHSLLSGILPVLLTITVCGQALAMPPHQSVVDQAAARPMDVHIQSTSHLHANGICTPDSFFTRYLSQRSHSPQAAAAGFNVLAILVQFSDKPSTVAGTFFDSMLFSTSGSTVKSYYNEISFGQVDLVTVNLPSALGWQSAPQTYSYYVNDLNAGNNPDNGLGDYPRNSQKLVEDLVDLVDPSVDFSNYDNDNDGYVDVLLVIHAGSGAEYSGSANDIWSHKWGISPRLKDGVYISSYTAQPEYWSLSPSVPMTIGVYAHELGHGFGLPDLYDTDGSSNGIGSWCLMAYGSWNGPGSLGGSPSHPSAWCRYQMGMATPINILTNSTGASIPQVETSGTMYRLWTSGTIGNEYFLVENRQQTGYDAYIPSNGLLVWHIDESKGGNTQEWYPPSAGTNHYLVGLEQADGLFQLEKKQSYGNSGDPFPGSSNNQNFNSTSLPNSDGYLSGGSFVTIQNISSSGSTMTADLIVGIAASVDDEIDVPNSFTLEQNYPNPFNPSTSIRFSLEKAASVQLDVINSLGQVITTLYSGMAPGGPSVVEWDGHTASGDPVASGLYFYRLQVGDNEEVRKMVLVR